MQNTVHADIPPVPMVRYIIQHKENFTFIYRLNNLLKFVEDVWLDKFFGD